MQYLYIIMITYIKKYSDIPKDFLNDFSNNIINFDNNIIDIDFNKIIKWINIRKDNLKKTLIKKFFKDSEYTIQRINKKTDHWGTIADEIKISFDCFKYLCTIKQNEETSKIKEYIKTIKILIQKYKEYSKRDLFKCLGIKKFYNNPIEKQKQGEFIIYEIKETLPIKIIYNKYFNKDTQNKLKIIMNVNVKDIEIIKKCINYSIKMKQCKKYKNIYDIDYETLEKMFLSCEYMKECIINNIKHEKKPFKNLNRMIKNENEKKYYLYVVNLWLM
jgi:hypothetical protein